MNWYVWQNIKGISSMIYRVGAILEMLGDGIKNFLFEVVCVQKIAIDSYQ
jgi:hypothetical protein